MDKGARAFYGKLYGLTIVAPTYLASAVVYGLLALRLSIIDEAAPFAWDTGTGILGFVLLAAWLAACIWLPEFLARLGFLAFRLPRHEVKPSASEQEKLTQALVPLPPRTPPDGAHELPPLDDELSPTLIDIGDVPMLAVEGFKENQLWISTAVLKQVPVGALKYLVAHERAHLHLKPGFQEHAVRTCIWLLSWPAVGLTWPNPFWVLAAAALNTVIWSWMTQALRNRRERAADQYAAQVTSRDDYATHLGDYLAYFEARGKPSIRRTRLAGLGLSAAEQEDLSRDDSDSNQA